MSHDPASGGEHDSSAVVRRRDRRPAARSSIEPCSTVTGCSVIWGRYRHSDTTRLRTVNGWPGMSAR